MTIDVKAWRKSQNDKAYTVRIGSAWIDKKGLTQIDFDALPVPDKDGRVRVFLEPRNETGQASQPMRGSAQTITPAPSHDDDEIPF